MNRFIVGALGAASALAPVLVIVGARSYSAAQPNGGSFSLLAPSLAGDPGQLITALSALATSVHGAAIAHRQAHSRLLWAAVTIFLLPLATAAWCFGELATRRLGLRVAVFVAGSIAAVPMIMMDSDGTLNDALSIWIAGARLVLVAIGVVVLSERVSLPRASTPVVNREAC